MPALLPLSTSAFFTHSFRVWAEQPIFDAIDTIACQRPMLTPTVKDQPHRAFTDFRGKFVRRLDHDASSYSGVGASGKPGAVQKHVFRDCITEVAKGL